MAEERTELLKRWTNESNELSINNMELTYEAVGHCKGEFVESSRVGVFDKLSINYSDILTTLIKAVGKNTINYASDLFISWEYLKERIENVDFHTDFYSWYGIREDGVDHDSFIESRGIDSKEYIGIYRVKVTYEVKENYYYNRSKTFIEMELQKIK